MRARRPQPQQHHHDHRAHGLVAQNAHGRPLEGMAENIEVFGAEDADPGEYHLLGLNQQIEKPQTERNIGIDQVGQPHPHAVEAQVEMNRVLSQRQRLDKGDVADKFEVVAQRVDPVQHEGHRQP